MNAFYQLLTANLREFLRDRMAIFWTVAFPIVFILIFGLIYGGSDSFSVDLGLVNEDNGPVSQTVVQTFQDATVFKLTSGNRDDELAALLAGDRDAVLIIPAGASQAIDQAHTAPIELHYDPARSTSQIIVSIVEQTLQAIAQQVRPQPDVFQLSQLPTQTRELSTIDYLIPGILAMSILNLGLFATAQPIISLRTQGILRRLGATPLPRTTLLAAYVTMRVLISLLQTTIILAVGMTFFGLAMVGNWLLFVGLLLLGTLAFIAIGFLVAAIARTEESGSALTSALQLPMLFLSGIFFPVQGLPAFIQPITNVLPLTYLADALRQTMVGATPDHTMGMNIVVLLGWLLGSTAVAARFFRWE